jgi:hypothetical protein
VAARTNEPHTPSAKMARRRGQRDRFFYAPPIGARPSLLVNEGDAVMFYTDLNAILDFAIDGPSP